MKICFSNSNMMLQLLVAYKTINANSFLAFYLSVFYQICIELYYQLLDNISVQA